MTQFPESQDSNQHPRLRAIAFPTRLAPRDIRGSKRGPVTGQRTGASDPPGSPCPQSSERREPGPEPSPPPPTSPHGGAMCQGQGQVAWSQACGGAVMSGEGSGQAAGQERLPLRLLSCPPSCRSLPHLPASQPQPRPPCSLPTPPAHHALPLSRGRSRGRGRACRPTGWKEGGQFQSAVPKAGLLTRTGGKPGIPGG